MTDPVVTASAPTRIDFGGGWTDVPPWPEEQGGFVCNLAIERRATVTLTCSKTRSKTPQPAEHANTNPLALAALRKAGLQNVSVAIQTDFPVEAGLGGSSAIGVALAAASAHLQQRSLHPNDLAEWSRELEVAELGIAGGFQDHYAAAWGGALALTCRHTRIAEPIPLSDNCIDQLEQSLTLVYSGQSRISAKTISAVLDAYRARNPQTVHALRQMADIARSMSAALAAGNIDQLAHLVDEQWQHQRSLHPKITTERIDAIEQLTRKAGATGFKALGASGGGCVLVCSPPQYTAQVRAAAALGGQVLPWRVARSGVQIVTAG